MKSHIFFKINLWIIAIGGSILLYLTLIDGVYIRKPNDMPWKITRQTTQDHYHPGDTVYVKVSVCVKRQGLQPRIEWQLIDDVITFYDVREQPIMDKGCYTDKIFKAETLPKDLVPDTYRLRGKLTLQSNPLKMLTYNITTNEFKVSK